MLLLRYWLLFELIRFCVGDFGGYVDTSFSCPIKTPVTVCKQVCVTNITFCPSNLVCQAGELLCNGVCVVGSVCDPSFVNPCDGGCFEHTVACPMNGVSGDTPACEAMFGEYYNVSQFCIAGDDYTYPTGPPYNQPGFIACYVWISVVVFAMVTFCFFNQRIFPVGQPKPLIDFENGDSSSTQLNWIHIAYKETWLGRLIFAMVVITILGFQVLLLLTTMFYYTNPDTGMRVVSWDPFPTGSESVLFIFEMIWTTALIFQLALKWPPSIRSLFFRRSTFEDATHISVFAPYPDKVLASVQNESHIQWIRSFLDASWSYINLFFAAIFSDTTRPLGIRGAFTSCSIFMDEKGQKYFTFRLRRYVFNPLTKSFEAGVVILPTRIGEIKSLEKGLSSEEVEKRRSLCGPNHVPLPTPSIFRTIREEFNKPFYLYQNLMSWSWFNFSYWHMGISNTLVYVLGGLSICQVMYESDVRFATLGKVDGTIQVLRNGSYQRLDFKELVPGDLVVLQTGPVPCDLVVIQAQQVLVDESALTGEAMPIVKTSFDNTDFDQEYSPKIYPKQTIMAGTTILNVSEGDVDANEETKIGTTSSSSSSMKDLAIVTRTGSFTSRGNLLRDILYIEQPKFKFDIEVEIVIVILLCYAAFGFGMVIYFTKNSPIPGWFYGMYVVNSCLPPLLPTVFIVSVGISANRLIKKRVACSIPQTIMLAGKVKVAFFDKTGTLTKQGMEFLSTTFESDLSTKSHVSSMSRAMSVCHSVTLLQSGKHIGNSVDVMMFLASGASIKSHKIEDQNHLIEKHNNGNTIQIIKRFDFNHHSMTQSVIVQELDGSYNVYVKGSAESIKKRCIISSLPDGYDKESDKSAMEGIYQIALAYRPIKLEEIQQDQSGGPFSIPRDQIESELSFLGFVNFKNVLKPETADCLQRIREGDVRCVMVSGDNVLTAIHIARESGLIDSNKRVILARNKQLEWIDPETKIPEELPSDLSTVELALTGEAWNEVRKLPSDDLKRIVQHTHIYGRCTPADKISVIQQSIEDGNITLMCGDGGNDCGALGTAHVGVALSDSEASVVSPFTSLDKSCLAVLDVLKEGRCTLSSAFSSYKYMIMYGQVETINQLINAYFSITFSEWCWVWMDGLWVISLAFSLPLADVRDKLSPERPTSSILGYQTMFSTIGVLILNFAFTCLGLGILFQQDWFQCRKWNSNDVSDVTSLGDNYESSVIFLVSGYQYIASAVAFSFGFNHRAPWYKNTWMNVFVLVWTFIHYFITLYPSHLSCVFRINCDNDHVTRFATSGSARIPINNPWNTTVMPMDFRLKILGIMMANQLALILWEVVFINGFIGRWFKDRFGKKNNHSNHPTTSTITLSNMTDQNNNKINQNNNSREIELSSMSHSTQHNHNNNNNNNNNADTAHVSSSV